MRAFMLFTSIWILTALPVVAQQIRSSEHPSFTRLMLPLAPESQWQIVREKSSVLIRFSDGPSEWQLDRIYDRITRARLRLVANDRESRGGLRLTLGCECEVLTNRIGGGFLAIDIRNAPSGQTIEPEEPVAPPSRNLWDTENKDPERQAKVLKSPDVSRRQKPVSSTDRNARRIADPKIETPSDTDRIEAQQAKSALTSRLLSAADAGLLNLKPEGAQPQNQGSELSPLLDLPVDPQLRIRSPLDRTVRTAEGDKPAQIDTCIDARLLELPSISQDQDVASQLAAIRRGLYDERGAVQKSKVIALAKLYISLEFSEEAKAALDAFEVSDPQADALNALSKILKGSGSNGSSPAKSWADCHGAGLMWALMAGVQPGPKAAKHTSDMVKYFESVPASLRRSIAERLTDALSATGDNETALKIKSIVDRSPKTEPLTPPLEIESAPSGGTRTRDATKETYADTGSMLSDQDFKALKVAALQALSQPGPDLGQIILDVGTAARQFRGQDLGYDFAKLEAQLVYASGNIDAAFKLADGIAARYPENADVIKEVRSDFIRLATPDLLGDSEYVRLILAEQSRFPTAGNSDDTRVKVAENLQDLGLANVALDILEPGRFLTDQQASVETAQALLAVNRPQDVPDALGPVQTEPGTRTRILALLRERRFDDALRITSTLPVGDELKQTTELLAGAWAQLDGNELPSELDDLLALISSGSKQTQFENRAVLSAGSDRPDVSSDPEQPRSVADILQTARSVREIVEKAERSLP